MKDRQANLFIVGAAKAGTTSLYHYLEQHPDVFMCPVKEPNYFGMDIDWSGFRADYKKATYLDEQAYFSRQKLMPLHNAFISTLQNYEQLYRDSGSQHIRGEASTSYLYSHLAAKEISYYNSGAKIIIILRDPVDRLISHYKMDFASGRQQEKNIAAGVRKDYEAPHKGYGISNLYVELSLYYEQIKRYLDTFERSQVLFLDFEDLSLRPEETMRNVCDFLNISTEFPFRAGIYNPTRMKSGITAKLRFLKKIIPLAAVEKLKKQKNLFFKNEIPVILDQSGKDYIKSLLSDNWEKAKILISGR